MDSLFFVDEAADDRLFVLVALEIPWAEESSCQRLLHDFRQTLREQDDVPLDFELHATDWIGGRGRPGDQLLSKARRADRFRDALASLAAWPGLRVWAVIAPRTASALATETLLKRLDAEFSHENDAALIVDAGREPVWTRAWRRVRPRRLGMSPVHTDSAQSQTLQMADWAAFALLRQESPLPALEARGIGRAWEDAFASLGEGVCVVRLLPAQADTP